MTNKIKPIAPNKIKPITPDQVEEEFLNQIPDEVIAAVNEMLISKSGGSATSITFFKDDLILLIAEKMGVDERTIYNKKWLNFELIFKEAGWIVTYDHPGFNESYRATFKFKRKN